MPIAYTLFYTATTYCLAYGTCVLEIPKTTMLALTMIGVFMAAGTVVSAMVPDRLRRRCTLIAGHRGCVVRGLVMVMLLRSHAHGGTGWICWL
ncbi:hypothetical protein E1292_48220 [Nonomuraea deserti]|uniref:MFS transporter n=1 Tax=Nonomuraea deserti TaxID=1848322 RepID=A0A4R4U9C5_9ACTN|nr:hypothetical protein [Nonomuraea deserti]TDC86286.1 hypothetical protein E1292_48220 [Nonomuraea deserti]